MMQAYSNQQHSQHAQTNGPSSGIRETRALLEEAIWLVYVEGGDRVVGPVSARQVAVGIRAGHVPAEASIQRTGEVFWTGVLDEPAIIAALKTV